MERNYTHMHAHMCIYELMLFIILFISRKYINDVTKNKMSYSIHETFIGNLRCVWYYIRWCVIKDKEDIVSALTNVAHPINLKRLWIQFPVRAQIGWGFKNIKIWFLLPQASQCPPAIPIWKYRKKPNERLKILWRLSVFPVILIFERYESLSYVTPA